MSRVSALKGFADVLPGESPRWQAIERIAREVAELYHFSEIRTPTLEEASLFHRGVGETSDIVRKETYTFADRDGTLVTLRPEGTAGVVRAVIEGGLLNDQGARVKVYYLTSNFRHENTQRGRLREHHQFGVEAFGVAGPEQDAECILLQLDFYRRCGLRELSLRLNSLGDRQSKQRYREALVAFLRPRASALSEDSQRRLDSNPLRILDSKDDRDRRAIEEAPPAREYLSDHSRQHLERLEALLSEAGVSYTLDGTLVRGFDYYTESLWEVTASGLGAQNAVGGGGRYDNLVESLGGRPTAGVGFGIGLERLLLALESQGTLLDTRPRPLVWIAAQGEAAKRSTWTLLAELRAANIAADMDLGDRNFKGQFKLAERNAAAWCIVVGDQELEAGTVALKDLARREQSSVPRNEVVSRLAALLQPTP